MSDQNNFVEVPDLDCSKTYAIGGVDKKSGKKNPVTATGYYIGTKQVPSKKSKTGLAALHIIQTLEGNHGIWGKTNLDQKMRAVKPGQLCKIDFVGMVETENNPMYKYKVAVDQTRTIEVVDGDTSEPAAEGQEASTAAASDQSDDPEAGGDEGDDSTPPDEVPPAQPKAPARPASAPTPDRQARVSNLVGGGKKA